METKYCPNCGRQIPADFKYCPNCGAEQPSVDNDTKPNESKEPSCFENPYLHQNIKIPDQDKKESPQPNYERHNQFETPTTVNSYYHKFKPRKQKKTMNSAPADISAAYLSAWDNFAVFSGTSSRSQYWWWNLCQAVTLFGPILLYFLLLNWFSIPIFLIVLFSLFFLFWIIYELATVIPQFAILTRRLRDVGLSNLAIALLIGLSFIPIVGIVTSIIILIYTIKPGIKR